MNNATNFSTGYIFKNIPSDFFKKKFNVEEKIKSKVLLLVLLLQFFLARVKIF